jgi:antibiotic biosynthesis monooxygenase (ABM) superfamily enzyme
MGSPKEGPSPPTWKLMLVKWLGLMPALLVVAYTLKWLKVEPLWLKLFLETLILVPLLNYVITPLVDSLFSNWLYRGIDKDAQRQSVNIGS